MDVDVVRVFTRGTEGGNHLGIVPRTLDVARMQEIARAVGFSETIFLDPDAPEPSVRIFTPANELPFAGHPLVGATWWLARRGRRPTTVLTAVGPVAVRATDDAAEVTAALGQPVRRGDPPAGLEHAEDVAVVEMPVPYVLCRLVSPEDVAAVRVDPTWGHVYVYADSGDGPVRARFLAGGSGIVEDPATGSAAVALAARLVSDGEAAGRRRIAQGEEIGHPSIIDLAWGEGSATLTGTVVAEPPIAVDA